MFTTTGSAGHLGPLVPFADAVRRSGGEVLIATRESSAGAGPRHRLRRVGVRRRARRRSATPTLAACAGCRCRRPTRAWRATSSAAWTPTPRSPACSTRAPRGARTCSSPSRASSRAAPSARISACPRRSSRSRSTPSSATWRPTSTTRCAGCGASTALRGGGARPARFTLMPPLLEDPALPGPPDVQRFREPDAPPPRSRTRRRDRSARLPDVRLGGAAARRRLPRPLPRGDRRARAAAGARARHDRSRPRSRRARSVPANVHVERWVPQASVMPHARVMVSHGGSGTLRAGSRPGSRRWSLPLFADQPYNAARVARARRGHRARRRTRPAWPPRCARSSPTRRYADARRGGRRRHPRAAAGRDRRRASARAGGGVREAA